MLILNGSNATATLGVALVGDAGNIVDAPTARPPSPT